MVEGDAWTGLIKIYQVLQTTGCLSEGQYTILKLKHLLTVNKLMDLHSILTPYLLLIVSEDNQLLDGTKGII
jgi:hypothetical protein